jgi:hypothetical protein
LALFKKKKKKKKKKKRPKLTRVLAIMISFAACFALRLGGLISGNSSLAPSIRTLIEEGADVLERIGSVTPHRNGMSALYGKYLKYIVKKAAITVETTTQARTLSGATPLAIGRPPVSFSPANRLNFNVTETPLDAHHQVTAFADPGALWSEPIQFSTMSDDQIVEALSRVTNDFDPDLSMYGAWDDNTALDWMNWSNMPEFGS